jgi:hypothetical protein
MDAGCVLPLRHFGKGDTMGKAPTSGSTITTDQELDQLIEEATVDCDDEEEQVSGFFSMIDENLALPFATQMLGVEVSVVSIEMDDYGGLKAVCERNGYRQNIDLADLPLPVPAPPGAEWVAAYQRWVRGSYDESEEEEE